MSFIFLEVNYDLEKWKRAPRVRLHKMKWRLITFVRGINLVFPIFIVQL